MWLQVGDQVGDAERVVTVEHFRRQVTIHLVLPSAVEPSPILPSAVEPSPILPSAVEPSAIRHGTSQDLPGRAAGDHQVAGQFLVQFEQSPQSPVSDRPLYLRVEGLGARIQVTRCLQAATGTSVSHDKQRRPGRPSGEFGA
jgi:hypothetical protein